MSDDRSAGRSRVLRSRALLAVLLLVALGTGTVSAGAGPAPPAAAFSTTDLAGFAPHVVHFHDASSGEGITAWAWDFGDGATSTERDPVHAYSVAGTYTVTLTVTGAGGTDSEVKAGYITVAPEMPSVSGDERYFLVSTEPPGADVYLEDISGTRHLAGSTAAGPLKITVLLMGTPVTSIIANLTGYRETVWEISEFPDRNGTLPVALTLEPIAPPAVVTVRDGRGPPTDTDGDDRHEDVNGNGRKDFADVVLYFDQMDWIAENEPVSAFDYNGNGRIDFADVVWLFNHL